MIIPWYSSLAQPHQASTRFHVGIDLAWADKSRRKANESGIVMLDPAGNVVAAGWTVGVDNTVAWLDIHVPVDALLFVDAPLVVNNETGQRRCESRSANVTGAGSSPPTPPTADPLVSPGWSF